MSSPLRQLLADAIEQGKPEVTQIVFNEAVALVAELNDMAATAIDAADFGLVANTQKHNIKQGLSQALGSIAAQLQTRTPAYVERLVVRLRGA